MVTVGRSLWREPRPADAPPIGRLDWLLVCVFVAAALVEGIVRPGLAWRPLVTVLALALVPALLWRRRRPLLAALVGWGVAGLLSVLQLTAHAGADGRGKPYAALRTTSTSSLIAGSPVRRLLNPITRCRAQPDSLLCRDRRRTRHRPDA